MVPEGGGEGAVHVGALEAEDGVEGGGGVRGERSRGWFGGRRRRWPVEGSRIVWVVGLWVRWWVIAGQETVREEEWGAARAWRWRSVGAVREEDEVDLVRDHFLRRILYIFFR